MNSRPWIWSNRWRLAAGAALVALLACWTPPAEPRFSLCGFRWLTGHPCPLCGMSRAFFALAKGHLLEALRFNALSPLAFVVSGAMLFGRNPRWEAVALALAAYGAARLAGLLP